LRQEFGWSMPVSNLRYWIFANTAPTKVDVAQFDNYHHLIHLEQQGWQINYARFTPVNGIDLPAKIELHNAKVKIKIVLKSFQVPIPKRA
jgi:outer membrane lipoprotein LolB